jgi:CTP synthase (UTP-ammonia lyase)
MRQQVTIALIGDSGAGYRQDASREALEHCSNSLQLDLCPQWCETEKLARAENLRMLRQLDGIWIVPGSPYKNLEGVLAAIQLAREAQIPLLGTCAGFQHLILEYVRNVLGRTCAAHAEYDPAARDQAISRLSCSLVGQKQSVKLDAQSMIGRIYGKNSAEEEFRCNYGLNSSYLEALRTSDLRIAAWDQAGEARAVELTSHPFFVGTLFIPQYSSSAAAPHPLICAFVQSALILTQNRRRSPSCTPA